MTAFRPRRSVLYMPGSNARALEKAKTLPADALILDLEDAVAPEEKESARGRVVEAIAAGGFGLREVVVRVNATTTPWGWADIEAAAASGAHAVLVPKVTCPDDICAVGRTLNRHGAPEALSVWAMMETPAAVLEAGRIAGAAGRAEGRRLGAFVIGTNDLAKETGVELANERAVVIPWLMTFVAAARAHGLAIIDGVFGDLADAEGFAAECAQGRALGMDGKTIIHPSQIGPANAAFAPRTEEVEWARKVIAAFEREENRTKGAIRLDGRMVERLHADIARRTVAIAEAIAARG